MSDNKNKREVKLKDGDRELSYHEGSLPSPETIQQYETILPGTFERILKMTEIEQKHRHDIEQNIQQHEYQLRNRAQYIALIFGVFMFSLAGGLIYNGQSIEGLAALITAIAAFIGPYIYINLKK
jgi:uncharacterized membrane protein